MNNVVLSELISFYKRNLCFNIFYAYCLSSENVMLEVFTQA
jgi:hypothetical protein